MFCLLITTQDVLIYTLISKINKEKLILKKCGGKRTIFIVIKQIKF